MRGDLAAAADLLTQALQRAPSFASAWFALGEIRERLGDRAGAIEAFKRAQGADPEDPHGAALRLARLGAAEARKAMPQAYVKTLFDQYAPRFDAALAHLDYRGPALLRARLQSALNEQGRSIHFQRIIDLGCGTGLAAAAFRQAADEIIGIDLSPAMISEARRKGLYDRLASGDMLAFLCAEDERSADLVLAADVLVYVADLVPVCCAVARVLHAQGLFALTVETHAGTGVVLGEKLRYAHAADYLWAALSAAALDVIALDPASTRVETGSTVPGLIAIAQRRAD